MDDLLTQKENPSGKNRHSLEMKSGKIVSRRQNDTNGESYNPLSNSFSLGKFLEVQKALGKLVFLATNSSAPKKSILKMNVRHCKNILVQIHCLMKRNLLHSGNFATLGHISQLFIYMLRQFSVPNSSDGPIFEKKTGERLALFKQKYGR